MAREVPIFSANMAFNLLGLLLLQLLLVASSSRDFLMGLSPPGLPGSTPTRHLMKNVEMPLTKMGADYHDHRGQQQQQRSCLQDMSQAGTTARQQKERGVDAKSTNGPKQAAEMYEGGRSVYEVVRLMETQRATTWAEMRAPKYGVDNTRAFHADYAEANPHPPRNN